LLSRSPFSFFGGGGGGKGPAGGAGRIGREVWLKVAAVALDDPLGDFFSGALSVVSFGTEFVVETLGGRPGWKEAPADRPIELDPFLMGGDLTISLY